MEIDKDRYVKNITSFMKELNEMELVIRKCVGMY